MTPLLEARDLRLSLPDRNARSGWGAGPMVDILKGVSLSIGRGESLGIVGESGSGKTSLGRTLIRLLEPTGGHLSFDGQDIAHADETALRPLRRRMQIIFQDPLSALNPRRTVADIVLAPLQSFGLAERGTAARDQVEALLRRVTLDPAIMNRFPHQLSGGQRQRVGIARAIGPKPDFILADEIVSGLDVSTQAQILDLLRLLQAEMGLSLAFISHDLSVIRVLCDRVLVLLHGKTVETGATRDVFAAPQHRYTRALIDSIPLPEIDHHWLSDTVLEDDGAQRAFVENTTGREKSMKIEGQTVLVTGTNRGIGRAFVDALLARGAAKIYAGTRDADKIADLVAAGNGRVVPILLDVTDSAQVAAAASAAKDVTLLINNAGRNHNVPIMIDDGLAAARDEMETNYFGTLAMCRAFAPILAANGGGAIINMLSILARVNLPVMGSLSASKAAGLSLTQAVRAQVAKADTHVLGVLPGATDTDMTAGLEMPKENPEDVVAAALDGLEAGEEEVYPGGMAQGMAQGLAADPKAVEKELAGYID